jgi:shikimate dehydrogenase
MTTPILCGLIGQGIGASLTPAMQEREAAEHGLVLHYRRLDLDVLGRGPDALPELLDAAEAEGYAGLNITYPCKQAVIPLLHALSPEAAALGAVNTVVFEAGRRTGHNTDAPGFAAAFRAGLAEAPRAHVVQLGAGGAGSAVAHALLSEGVQRLTIADLDALRATALAAALCARFGEGRADACTDPAEPLRAADGLVNCTPVGMAKLPGLPVQAAVLRPSLWVAEIVYFPLETALLRGARALGCRTLDGGGMAVFQAAGAFRLFTGRDADAARMRRHFLALTG